MIACCILYQLKYFTSNITVILYYDACVATVITVSFDRNHFRVVDVAGRSHRRYSAGAIVSRRQVTKALVSGAIALLQVIVARPSQAGSFL